MFDHRAKRKGKESCVLMSTLWYVHVTGWRSKHENSILKYSALKGVQSYDHFIMGCNSIEIEDIDGYNEAYNIEADSVNIKPRKTKFIPQSYYSCNYCGRWYRSRTSLGLHRRLECGKEPAFQCPYCPLKTHQKGNLQVHIKKKHTDKIIIEEAPNNNGLSHHPAGD